jgi:hypothetical protein
MNGDLLGRAEEFIWRNARLLDRARFAFHFRDGSPDAVLAALRPYQNEDGGFGNALEPDIRCPESQPVPVQHALEIMDEARFDPEIARRLCAYLRAITTAEGGVPFVLPSVSRYPHAPWWRAEDPPRAALNPTAAIAGLLHKQRVEDPWLAPATDFCWRAIAGREPQSEHDLLVVFVFLAHIPDRDRAATEFARLGQYLRTSGLAAESGATGYVKKALDWAPTPDDPLRAFFRADEIAANLDALVAEQRPDGGWPISWPPLSPGCELEWRGWVTLSALLTLRANGRLGA